jgi:hypothetical protein
MQIVTGFLKFYWNSDKLVMTIEQLGRIGNVRLFPGKYRH